ncbi:hypothetical protein DPMN_059583 [Dreissena polymorpha]|uniref:Uncharacterized protein n=1 Tax=Dreissena polymorpha TaxID=45954 RepID=A0A9D4HF74_DREPO|nr:hypothetical protein DPMN_059583 [Dreissena polymorpha]
MKTLYKNNKNNLIHLAVTDGKRLVTSVSWSAFPSNLLAPPPRAVSGTGRKWIPSVLYRISNVAVHSCLSARPCVTTPVTS